MGGRARFTQLESTVEQYPGASCLTWPAQSEPPDSVERPLLGTEGTLPDVRNLTAIGEKRTSDETDASSLFDPSRT
jgi:hypothetical protein